MYKKTILLILMTALMASLSFAATIGVADDQRYSSNAPSDDAGLSCKSLASGAFSFVEFTIGGTAVGSANLYLYLSSGGTLSDTWEVNLTGAQYDMTEGSAVDGFRDAENNPLWDVAATPVSVDASDNLTWMSFDITTFYNAHLGETVTFNVFTTSTMSGDGPKFEDREGSMGNAANAAYIDTRNCGSGSAGTKAWCPDPADGTTGDYAAIDLSWLAPADANESFTYDVYFDTDSNPGDQFPILSDDTTVTNVEISGPLAVNQQYWWRVDAIDPNVSNPNTRTGDVWTFTVGVTSPERVAPDPGTDLDLGVVLDWTSDTSSLIDHHKLTLTNVTDATSVVVDPIAAGTTDYDLNADTNTWAIMDYGKDYTWQIEEIDSSSGVLVTGPVWTFNTVALECQLSVDADIDGSGDCEVNLDDLAIIAGAWLDCDLTLPGGGAIPYASKDPCP